MPRPITSSHISAILNKLNVKITTKKTWYDFYSHTSAIPSLDTYAKLTQNNLSSNLSNWRKMIGCSLQSFDNLHLTGQRSLLSKHQKFLHQYCQYLPISEQNATVPCTRPAHIFGYPWSGKSKMKNSIAKLAASWKSKINARKNWPKNAKLAAHLSQGGTYQLAMSA